MGQIVAIGTAVPEFKYSQEEILQFMLRDMTEQSVKERRLLSFIFKKSGISNRYSILPDFDVSTARADLFRQAETMPSNVEQRMHLFSERAPYLVMMAIEKCLKGVDHGDITHLITVTCTGLSAPGLDVELTELLHLPDNVQRSAVNFMGCHGGFHAMRQAHHICNHDPTANVLIADVELSTIHFQKNTSSDEMLANTLFADGAAAALVSGADSKYHSKVSMSNFHSKLVLKGKSAMAWKISANGFRMNLSTQVPELISEDFHQMLTNIFEHDLPDENMEEVLWAFHPGGIRVLESITKIAGITKEQMWASYQVLRDYGNMSSCTIFFVLEQLMDEIIATKKPVVAAGFGPGLSMELMVLKAN